MAIPAIFKSRPASTRNYCPDKDLRSDAAGLSAPATARPPRGEMLPPEGPVDADLARLLAAWPGLPEHIKAAIMALVMTAAGR